MKKTEIKTGRRERREKKEEYRGRKEAGAIYCNMSTLKAAERVLEKRKHRYCPWVNDVYLLYSA